MRILHTVEYYAPSLGGAQEVVKQISERLVARGHEVTVATTKLPARTDKRLNGVAIEEFDIAEPGAIDRYHALLCEQHFDVVMNYAAQSWPTDATFPVLERMTAARVLAPCGFSGLYQANWRFYFALLPVYLRRYDRLLFHSTTYRDAAFARAHGIDGGALVTNGAAPEEFAGPVDDFRARHGIARELPLVLTIGTHTGLKGHAEAMRAFRRARIGRAVLAVIGNAQEGGGGCHGDCVERARKTTRLSLGRKRVMLLDLPRAEVLAAYRAADLFLFLSSIECSPLVLFEAAAAGLPFVASDAGNAREIAEWTGGGEIVAGSRTAEGLVYASVDEAARAIERLVGDPARRRAMGERARAVFLERFTWERVAATYEAEYERAIAARRARLAAAT